MLAMKFVNFDWHVSIITQPKLQSNSNKSNEWNSNNLVPTICTDKNNKFNEISSFLVLNDENPNFCCD